MSLFTRNNGTREYNGEFVTTTPSTKLFSGTAHADLTAACHAATGYADTENLTPDEKAVVVKHEEERSKFFEIKRVEVLLSEAADQLNADWEKKGLTYRMRVGDSKTLVVYPVGEQEPTQNDVLQFGTSMKSTLLVDHPHAGKQVLSLKAIDDRVELAELIENTKKRVFVEAAQSWEQAEKTLQEHSVAGLDKQWAQDTKRVLSAIGAKIATQDHDYFNAWVRSAQHPAKYPLIDELVFLGGTCNGSTWRDDFVKMFKQEYYNPVVPNWTPADQQNEEIQKKAATVIMYGITAKQLGFYSFAEMAVSAFRNPDKTIIIAFLDHDGPFSKPLQASIEAIASLMGDLPNVKVFSNKVKTALYLNSRISEVTEEK